MECLDNPDNPDGRDQGATTVIKNHPLKIMNPNKFHVNLASSCWEYVVLCPYFFAMHNFARCFQVFSKSIILFL